MPFTSYKSGLTVDDEPLYRSERGSVDGVASLDGTGKIPVTELPAISLSNTFVVGSQAAMLSLTAETGDVAVRTDISKCFILAGSNPAVLGDWQELLTPPDTVLSVNSQVGIVSLLTTDVPEGANLYFTGARVLAAVLTGFVSGAGTITAADTVLSAIEKLNGNMAGYVPTSRTVSINGNTQDLSANRSYEVKGCYVLGKSTTAVSTTNTTNEEIIYSFAVAAGEVQAGDIIDIYALFTLLQSSANNKDFRIRFSSDGNIAGTNAIGFSRTTTSNQSVGYNRIIAVKNSTTIITMGQNGVGTPTSYGNQVVNTNATVTVPDLTSAFYILITTQKGLGTETLQGEFAIAKLHR